MCRPAPFKRMRRRPEGGGELFRAEHRNHPLGPGLPVDDTADHRMLELLNIVDEHS